MTKYYLIFLLVVLFNFTLGDLFLQVFLPRKDYKQTSWDFRRLAFGLITGNILLILFYSMIVTNIVTVNVFWLLLIFPAYKKLRLNWDVKFNTKIIWQLLIVSSIIWILQWGFMLDDSSLYDADKLLYSDISYFLNETGVEGIYNNMAEMHPQYFYGVTPYHYFELWNNSLIYNIFGLSSIESLVALSYPFYIVTFYLMLLVLLDFTKLKNNIKIILGLLFLFIGPVYLDYYEFWIDDGNFFLNTTVFNIPGHMHNALTFANFGQKHLPFITLISVVVFLIIKKQSSFAFYFLTIIPIINIGVFPACVAGVSLYCLKLLLTKDFKAFFKHSVFLGIFIISYLLFYTELGVPKTIASDLIYTFKSGLNFKGEVLRLVSRLVVPIIYSVILYFLFLLPLLFNIKEYSSTLKKHLDLIIVLIGGLIGGLLTIPMLIGLNSAQFFSYAIPLINLAFVLIFIRLINLGFYFKITSAFIVIGLVFNFASNCNNKHQRSLNEFYSNEYLESIDSLFDNKRDKVKIGYLMADSIVNRFLPPVWYVYKPGELIQYHNQFRFYSLNYPFVTYEDIEKESYFSQNNQMSYFLNETVIDRNSFKKEQVRFIKEKKLEYIVASEGATIPLEFSSYIKQRIYDKKSKEKILILK